MLEPNGMKDMKGVNMRYEYERVELDKNSRAMNAELGRHREIIDRKAAEGARYVGWIPAVQGPSGKVIELDLVFEVE